MPVDPLSVLPPTGEEPSATARSEASEQELAQLRSQVQCLTVALEDAHRMKDQFLSVISHELRTPLNFITGFASILADEVSGPLTPPQHVHLARVLEGADRMLVLVNNLLDASRMAAGRFQVDLALTDYRGVIGEVLGILAGQAGQRAIRLEASLLISRELFLDGLRLVQVLSNLVGNAIKFSPDGGRVLVRVHEADGCLITEIEDEGPGIPETQLPRLFQPFSQLDMTSTRKTGGAGLGLAISRTIVEAHGGQIGVRQAATGGSTFWFHLPARYEA